MYSELRAVMSPGGPGAGRHPPMRTLLPTWTKPTEEVPACLARTLRSQDQAHSAPCWTQASSSPTSHHSLLQGLSHTCSWVSLMSPPRAEE